MATLAETLKQNPILKLHEEGGKFLFFHLLLFIFIYGNNMNYGNEIITMHVGRNVLRTKGGADNQAATERI